MHGASFMPELLALLSNFPLISYFNIASCRLSARGSPRTNLSWQLKIKTATCTLLRASIKTLFLAQIEWNRKWLFVLQNRHVGATQKVLLKPDRKSRFNAAVQQFQVKFFSSGVRASFNCRQHNFCYWLDKWIISHHC